MGGGWPGGGVSVGGGVVSGEGRRGQWGGGGLGGVVSCGLCFGCCWLSGHGYVCWVGFKDKGPDFNGTGPTSTREHPTKP